MVFAGKKVRNTLFCAIITNMFLKFRRFAIFQNGQNSAIIRLLLNVVMF